MSDLKPCPCGHIPKELNISFGSSGGYASADGDCCGYWFVEFETRRSVLGSERCSELAEKKWNDAPRGG